MTNLKQKCLFSGVLFLLLILSVHYFITFFNLILQKAIWNMVHEYEELCCDKAAAKGVHQQLFDY